MHARQLVAVQPIGEGLGVDPRRAGQLERPRGAAALGGQRALEQHRRRDRRWRCRASGCWARASPTARRSRRRRRRARQPSIVTTSTSAPSPKCSLKSRASSPMVRPWRIGIGNWPTNDSKPRTERRAFHRHAADRIGPIADDDRHAVAGAGPQAVGHRVDVGVDAGADVLQVDDQHVEPVEHLGGGLAGLAVERVDRHLARGVAGVRRLDHVVLDVGCESRAAGRRWRPASRPRRAGPARRRGRSGRPPTPGWRPCRRGAPRRRPESSRSVDPRVTGMAMYRARAAGSGYRLWSRKPGPPADRDVDHRRRARLQSRRVMATAAPGLDDPAEAECR